MVKRMSPEGENRRDITSLRSASVSMLRASHPSSLKHVPQLRKRVPSLDASTDKETEFSADDFILTFDTSHSLPWVLLYHVNVCADKPADNSKAVPESSVLDNTFFIIDMFSCLENIQIQ